MQNAPENEAQVIEALHYGKSKLTGDSLVRIFRSQLDLGSNLLEAYKAALLTHLGVCRQGEAITMAQLEALDAEM